MSSLTYPLQVINGTVHLTDDPIAVIGQAIASAIRTRQLERVFRPYYGRDRVVFTTLNYRSQLLNEVKQWVQTGLVGYEPVDLSIRGRFDESGGLMAITIIYAVTGIQTKGTLSYSLEELAT